MAIRFDSETSCRAAYIDYYTNKNTNVTKEDMCRIVQRYDDKTRQSWQRTYLATSQDENPYEFNDEEFENIRLESYNETEAKYGEDTNVNAEKARTLGDGATTGIAAGGAVAGLAISAGVGGMGGNGFLGKLLGKLGGLFKQGTIEKGSWMLKSGSDAKSFNKGGFVGYIISGLSCAFAFAVGLNAKTNNANEEEIKAVNDLYGEMEQQQETITEQNNELAKTQKEIENASDKAIKENNKANKDIQTRATQHQTYSNTYNVLQAKIDRGQTLSASETSLYNGIFSIMDNSNNTIEARIAKADDNLETNMNTISNFETKFDAVATNIANVQGVTDYAAEIDEATQKSCTSQAKIQKINSIAGYAAAAGMGIATATFAAELGFVNPIAWVVIAGGLALAAMAILGGVWSGKSSQKQTEWAQQASNEVNLRVQTQDANATLQDNFDGSVDIYNQSKAGIDGASVNKPNNLQQVTRKNTFINGQNNGNNGDDDNGNRRPRYLT